MSVFLRTNQPKMKLIGIVRGVDAALTALAILMAFITLVDLLRLGANDRSVGGVNPAPMPGVKAEEVDSYAPASVREGAQTQDAEPAGGVAEPPEQ